MLSRSILLIAAFYVFEAQAGPFDDSLQVVVERLTDRINANGHLSMAVLSFTDGSGGKLLLGEFLSDELTYRLALQLEHTNLVERRTLDRLLEEQRLSASGLVADATAVRLGELVSAGVILSGTIRALDKRTLRLDLRLLDVESGMILAMERATLPIPDGFDHRSLKRDLPDQQDAQEQEPIRNGPWRMHAGFAHGTYFDQQHQAVFSDMLWQPGRLGIGLRVQLMPALIGDTPQRVGFGHFTRTDALGSMEWDPFTGEQAPANGEVYLVAANDLDHGAATVIDAMEGGAASARFDQLHVVDAKARSWSVSVPMRWYISGDMQHGHGPRIFLEIGYGVDVIFDNITFDVIRLSGTNAGGTINYDVQGFRTTAYSYADRKEQAWLWNGILGAGAELGRFALGVSWKHSFNATLPFNESDMRKVGGDPITLALLNGSVLEDPQVLSEIEQEGAILFGNTNMDWLSGTSAGMSRFLDRSHMQFSLAFRLF